MRYGDLAGLVTALLRVGNLVFNLNSASTCFDHALGKQVCSLFVTKARVYVGDNWHNVCFKVINLFNDAVGVLTLLTGFVELSKNVAQLARISLFQKGINFFNEVRYCGLLMHALVRQRAKL